MDSKQKVKGELQITDSDIRKHAPDLINKRTQLASDLHLVNKIKPQIDPLMKQIAQVSQSVMSSRVKNPKQIVRKVTQKRMEDRNYQLSDINDLLGYRFTVENPADESKVKEAVEQAAKRGVFVIIKQQERDKQDYHAYHYDVAFPLSKTKSIRGEIQVIDARSEAQAAAGHDLHFAYGDTPPKKMQDKLKKQTAVINQLPPIKAKLVADALVDEHKKMNDNPLPKGTVDSVLKIAHYK